MMGNTIENNPETKLERFKRWVRENGVALGGITVMLGTLITAIVSLLESGATAAKKAVESTTDLLKKFARLAKKLGPVLGKIGSAAISSFAILLKYASKALEFLASNLWLLFLLVAYIIYEYFKKKYRKSES